MTKNQRISEALKIAERYGGIDCAHHKAWVIDQMCRVLLGEDYGGWVARIENGEDGPNTYSWQKGIAP